MANMAINIFGIECRCNSDREMNALYDLNKAMKSLQKYKSNNMLGRVDGMLDMLLPLGVIDGDTYMELSEKAFKLMMNKEVA